MDFSEYIVFFASCIVTFIFLKQWYLPLFKTLETTGSNATKKILGSLPVIFAVFIYFILKNFASFDVIGIYVIFYIILGFAWMFVCLLLMKIFFDIHWPDDPLHRNNKSSLIAITANFFASAFIYAGSNTGDGPGWWCVLFAGSLGIASWIILGLIIHFFTGIFDRITIERNTGCSVRYLIYILLSGAILGYGCSGDWTSFSMTVIEFSAAWPVLPLTAVFIIIEVIIRQKEKYGVSN